MHIPDVVFSPMSSFLFKASCWQSHLVSSFAIIRLVCYFKVNWFLFLEKTSNLKQKESECQPLMHSLTISVLVSFSWDESSSISSGLSDGSDNLSSEEFNTSPTLNSLPTTPIGSRRNSAIVVSNAHVTHTPRNRRVCCSVLDWMTS